MEFQSVLAIRIPQNIDIYQLYKATHDDDTNTVTKATKTTAESRKATKEQIPQNDNDDEDDDYNDKGTDATKQKAGLLVTLDSGKYQVDLSNTEQINLESHMLRFVKRVPQQ